MTLILQKGSLIVLGGIALSEHNRSSLAIPHQPVKTDKRLANGGMRRYFVANKLTFSFSWEKLPALDEQTVDGKAARNSIRNLWLANPGEIVMTYKEVNNNNNQISSQYTVFIDTYQDELLKRLSYQQWNVQMTLIEK